MKLNASRIIIGDYFGTDKTDMKEIITEIKAFMNDIDKRYKSEGRECKEYGIMFIPSASVRGFKVAVIFNLNNDMNGQLTLMMDPSLISGDFDSYEFKKELIKALLEEVV